MQTRQILWILVGLGLLLLACGFVGSATPPPAPPQGKIEVDEQAAKRVEDNFNQAMQESNESHPFEFRISDQEITSLAVSLLAQRADVPFSEPQIWFSEGQIFATATVEGLGPSPFDAYIEATPKVIERGIIEVEINTAKMGNIAIPKGMSESLSQTINDSLADLDLGLDVQEIQVRKGELIIRGVKSQ